MCEPAAHLKSVKLLNPHIYTACFYPRYVTCESYARLVYCRKTDHVFFLFFLHTYCKCFGSGAQSLTNCPQFKQISPSFAAPRSVNNCVDNPQICFLSKAGSQCLN